MHERLRHTLRLASLIRNQALAHLNNQLANQALAGRNVNRAMEQYLALHRRLAKAYGHKWLAAAQTLADQTESALDDLHYEIEGCRRQRRDHSQPISSLGDILRDLHQLEEEFGGWEYEEQTLTLSAQTDPIELEGINLGPFAIQLHLRELGRSDPLSAFTVVAQEPNGAGGRDTVTHPHVSDEKLCAGDALIPIRAALETGRICDFFILVRSVLQTYNRHSAYVRLEEWDGEPCHDCGYLLDSDERTYCEHCENDFCDSCSSLCHQCDQAACLSCLETCPHCQERACPNCRRECDECGQTCCEGCLNEGLCPNCSKEKEESHESSQPDQTSDNHTSAQSEDPDQAPDPVQTVVPVAAAA
jgi:hypothetical protein